MHGFDRKGLDAFTQANEGAPPPVFVGRDGVIESVLSDARKAWHATSSGERAKATQILQGAPGAGKSSVLREIRQRATRATPKPSESDAPAPRVLMLTTGNIHGPEDILGPLSAIVLPGRNVGQEAQDRIRSAASRLFGLEVDGAESRKPDPEMQKWSVFRQWVETWSLGAGLPAPVVIAIDEAQRFERAKEDPVSKLLQSVHDGEAGLPLTLVLAGLGDTSAVAAEMDLTRPKDVVEIGGLSTDQVMDLIAGFCRRFGIDASGHEGMFADLAGPCEGWPRHLHLLLQAFARQALAADGWLDQVDWERVKLESVDSRLHYCHRQRSPEMREADVLTARVMRDLKCGSSWSAVAKLIEDGIEDRPGSRLPEGMSPKLYFRHLVHRGALHESSDGQIHCPIPSFRKHLIEAGGLDANAAPKEPEQDDGLSFSM